MFDSEILSLGPHLVDLTNIERILDRSLTLDELINLAGDRFDEIHGIEEELDRKKEMELKELPINRIRDFENILRKIFFILIINK
jgi:hypothetical protein